MQLTSIDTALQAAPVAATTPSSQPQQPSAIPRLVTRPNPAPKSPPYGDPGPKSPISSVTPPVSPVAGVAPVSFASPSPNKAGAARPVTTFMAPRPYAAPTLPPKPALSSLPPKPSPSSTFIPKPVQFTPPKKPASNSKTNEAPSLKPLDGNESTHQTMAPKPFSSSGINTRPVTFRPTSLSPRPAPFTPPMKSPSEGSGPRPAPFVPPPSKSPSETSGPRPVPFSPPSKSATGAPKPAPFYPPTSLPRPVTFNPRPSMGPKPVLHSQGAGSNEETSPLSPTSPTDQLDVRKSARMPSGIPRKATANPDIEKMSFREKQKYFEKEIKDSSEPKAPGEEEEEVTPDHDLDQVLSKMKSLEVDAVQAQAVIAKAQELSRDPANGTEANHPNHNGDSRMEVSRNQLIGKGLKESSH
ncbi:hypothetical protein PoB_007634100 [Plakobranchus ocellatus]|uniref:Uncharacterized protein n=1 Tax=Plakobranchus ocellatus TaxID=259542 RepID=A0AAV4E0J5_9GAST|nr:hypothetical protein PoB_007634100 [Plakobranchus ocellatus]